LRINDDRCLKLIISLYLHTDDKRNTRLKVSASSVQYQMNDDNDSWIMRFDYAREPGNEHPIAHVHVRGDLHENCLREDRALERVHIPTHRVSLEAIARLLIQEFDVQANEPEELWRPVLAFTEREFQRIAHPPV
jgi:hypothetical protein